MNITESPGEPSSNGREDGDASNGSERPLKKARYAWQVKGKYRLKNETDETNKSTIIAAASTEPSSSNRSNNISDVEDYRIENYSQLDSVIDSENSLLTPNTSVLREQIQFPRYISSGRRLPPCPPAISNHSSDVLDYCWSHAFTQQELVKISEDRCILEWQYKQVMQSSIDNILNQAFERLLDVPGDDGNSRFLAFDFAEFINHFPGDNSVENEGILMAISAHGLQNTSNSSIDNHDSESRSSLVNMASLLENWSPSPPDDDKPIDKESNESQTRQSSNQNAPAIETFEYFSEPSQSPRSDNNQNSNLDTPDEGNFDFMNAAVLYAIKSKGLAVSGTEYG